MHVRSPAMTVSEFLQRVQREKCQPGNHHEIAPPLSEDELLEWRSRHPGVGLPEDLIALARAANGVFLYVHANLPNGYVGLAPLREWEEASVVFWGTRAPADETRPPTRSWFAISRHADGSDYVALDCSRGCYFHVDTCGVDESCPIGTSVHELLEWIWRNWVVSLRPAVNGDSNAMP